MRDVCNPHRARARAVSQIVRCERQRSALVWIQNACADGSPTRGRNGVQPLNPQNLATAAKEPARASGEAAPANRRPQGVKSSGAAQRESKPGLEAETVPLPQTEVKSMSQPQQAPQKERWPLGKLRVSQACPDHNARIALPVSALKDHRKKRGSGASTRTGAPQPPFMRRYAARCLVSAPCTSLRMLSQAARSIAAW